jgi:archaellum component FlaC
MMELSELKTKILALLKTDEEFRYAVAGMIGYDEILKRLQKHDEKFEEIVSILNRHEEILARHEEKFKEILAQIKEIRESQSRLENRVNSLENRMDSLEKSVNSLEKRVDSLEKRVGSLEERVDSLASAMIAGFAELSKFAGITFEEFVRKFLTASLQKSGQIPQGVELTRKVIDGEEIDIFLEDPLIVGEVTAHADTPQEAEKLLKKAELAKTRYAKEPRKILVILTAKRDVAQEIQKKAKEKNIELIIGRIID